MHSVPGIVSIPGLLIRNPINFELANICILIYDCLKICVYILIIMSVILEANPKRKKLWLIGVFNQIPYCCW